MQKTNIDYWNKVLENPTPTYKKLFTEEYQYLQNHTPKNSFVLDIGCGNGRNIETILSITKNVTGIDIEENAVKEAKEKFQHISEINIVKGSVFELPFNNKSFDVVILMCTLVNFDNKKIEALREMKRVMNDTGKLIISVYSEDALENRLEQYKKINLPIKGVAGNKVTFQDFSEAGTSEQFSLSDIETLGKKIGLKVRNLKKIPNIAYIFEYTLN